MAYCDGNSFRLAHKGGAGGHGGHVPPPLYEEAGASEGGRIPTIPTTSTTSPAVVPVEQRRGEGRINVPGRKSLNNPRRDPLTVEPEWGHSELAGPMDNPGGCARGVRRPESGEHRRTCGESLLTVAQACERLNVSTSTLYGWVWQRRVPFVKMGRCLRFESRQLEAFIAADRHAQLS